MINTIMLGIAGWQIGAWIAHIVLYLICGSKIKRFEKNMKEIEKKLKVLP